MVLHSIRKCLQVSQRRSNAPVILDETMIIPRETEKTPQALKHPRHGPAEHDLNFLLVHGETSPWYNVAKIVDFCAPEVAFALLSKKMIIFSEGEEWVGGGLHVPAKIYCRQKCHQKEQKWICEDTRWIHCSLKLETWTAHLWGQKTWQGIRSGRRECEKRFWEYLLWRHGFDVIRIINQAWRKIMSCAIRLSNCQCDV